MNKKLSVFYKEDPTTGERLRIAAILCPQCETKFSLSSINHPEMDRLEYNVKNLRGALTKAIDEIQRGYNAIAELEERDEGDVEGGEEFLNKLRATLEITGRAPKYE